MKGDRKRQKVSGAIALVSTAGALALAIVTAGIPCMARQPGVLDRLASLESCVLGRSYHEGTVEQRVAALEAKTLGHTQSGPLAARLSALEQVVGKSSAQLLPPVAPQLDLGAGPTAAPARQNRQSAFQADRPLSNQPCADGRILQGTATTYGASSAGAQASSYQGYSPAPGIPGPAPFRSPLPPYYSGSCRTAASVPPMPAGSIRWSASSGAAGKEFAGALGSQVMQSVVSGRGLSGSSTINALHCPICRLLHL